MAITPQPFPIPFAQGLDTKTDPKQVKVGKFLSLQNSVFDEGALLKKRNGYGLLTTLPDTTYVYATTLNGNLTAIGPNIAAYSSANKTWIPKGSIQPMQVSTLPLVRNSINQIACDSVTAPNGLACTVYSETTGAATDYKYVIADSVTGQNIIQPTLIPVASGAVSGSARVFLLGNYFVVVFTNLISATSHLQYIAISTENPSQVTANADIASAYIPSTTLSWDAVSFNNNLYVAYNTTTGGQAVKVTYLPVTSAAIGGAPVSATTFTGYAASLMTLAVDSTISNPLVYVSFYSLSGTVGYTVAVDLLLNEAMIPIQTISSGTILNLASVAQNGKFTLFYEVSNVYAYDNAIASNYINSISVTPAGLPVTFRSIFSSGAATITASSATGLSNGMYLVDNTTIANLAANTTFTHSSTTLTLSANTTGNSASSPGDSLSAQALTLSAVTTIIRSVGLASKAFLLDGVAYFLAAYSSKFQPSYFLINGSTSLSTSPVIVGKLAYENGGGYLTLGLPGVTLIGSSASLPYLFKDLIEALSTNNVSQQTTAGGIYSQTGINLGTFDFTSKGIDTAEIGHDLHISGGFLWMYDGYLPVEHSFFLWPDSVEVTSNASAVTPTGTVTSGSPIVTAVSSMAGVGVGASVTGTAIPGSTTIIAVGTNSFTMSANATGTHVAETVTVTGNISTAQAYYYQAVYEWSDNQGNIFRSAGSIPVTITTSGTTSTNTISIPTLRLTYKTANPLKITLYRWSAAQQVYYQVTSITAPLLNSTTTDSVTFVDSVADATILGNEIIYTTGGVVENINSTATNIMALFDSRLWTVDAEDPNLLNFSKQVIEGVPVDMSDLLTYYVPPNTGTEEASGPITALFPMDDKLIIFSAEKIVYINGSGPDNTGQNSQYPLAPIFITSTVGCTEQQSIALTPTGLQFQTDKGIWMLDRGSLMVSYVGAGVQAFNGSEVNSANLIPETTQIRFTLDTGQTLMYDYYYDQWGTFVGCPAISSTIYQGLHTYINAQGQVLQETPGVYLDNTNPVLISFLTGHIQLTGISGYQRLWELQLLGQYFSPHLLNFQIGYDFGPLSEQALIQPTNYTGVYGSDQVYGQTSPYGGGGTLEQWRIQPSQELCQAFQISVQEVFDPSFGTKAGAGFTLSAMTCVLGILRGYRPVKATNTVGTV